jgi:hypothetical protein
MHLLRSVGFALLAFTGTVGVGVPVTVSFPGPPPASA